MTTPYYADATVRIFHGDCLDVLRELPDTSVDAVVTDPPYSLSFMGRHWDAHENPAAFQAWCLAWATECLRVLKPGGHMLAFGGTRTSHRLACAVEDAGFEIRDSIAWLYGSGFPKSLDVSKAIDRARDDKADVLAVGQWLCQQIKASGVSRKRIAQHFGIDPRGVDLWAPKPTDNSATQRVHTPTWEQWEELSDLLTLPADMDEEVWRLNGRKGMPGDHWDSREVVGQSAHKSGIGNATAGHYTVGGTVAEHVAITAPATDAARTWQGWGTALKPAHEPIVVARKPLAGTVAANVLAHGTGALNVDGCRVGHSEVLSGGTGTTGKHEGWDRPWMHDGTEREGYNSTAGRWPANVVLDESQAAALDAQSGESVSTSRPRHNTAEAHNRTASMGSTNADWTTGGHDDTGGASRFFFIAREDDPCGSDASTDTTGITTPESSAGGEWSSAAPVEQLTSTRFRYTAKASTDERPRIDGVAHPTTKPLALMRWLVRLVTPPGGTVLEPFAGSGTTVEACILEGFACIAIEREAEYLPLIRQRIHRRRDPVEAVRGSGEDAGLFDLLGGEDS